MNFYENIGNFGQLDLDFLICVSFSTMKEYFISEQQVKRLKKLKLVCNGKNFLFFSTFYFFHS